MPNGSRTCTFSQCILSCAAVLLAGLPVEHYEGNGQLGSRLSEVRGDGVSGDER